MSNLRTGIYGSYYGSFYNQSVTLNTEQKEINAVYIYKYLSARGWTLNAISGMLGNIEYESAINPGRWEGDDVGEGPGYGLVQWTPYTNYTNWCAQMGYADPSEMDNNLARIIYELENGGQYYATGGYPESFSEFSTSTKSPYYLACAFAWNYERSAVVLWGANSYAEAQTLTEEQKEANRERLRQQRGNSAEKWYTFLSGETPPTPTPPVIRRKKKYNFVLFKKRRWLLQ